jgi:hypothetical protein
VNFRVGVVDVKPRARVRVYLPAPRDRVRGVCVHLGALGEQTFARRDWLARELVKSSTRRAHTSSGFAAMASSPRRVSARFRRTGLARASRGSIPVTSSAFRSHHALADGIHGAFARADQEPG